MRLHGLFYGEDIDPDSCAIFDKYTFERRGESPNGTGASRGWASILLNLLDSIAIHLGAVSISLSDSSDVKSLRYKCKGYSFVKMSSLYLLKHGFTLYNAFGYIPSYKCEYDHLLVHGNYVLSIFQQIKSDINFKTFECDSFPKYQERLFAELLQYFPDTMKSGQPQILKAQTKLVNKTWVSALHQKDGKPTFAMSEYVPIF